MMTTMLALAFALSSIVNLILITTRKPRKSKIEPITPEQERHNKIVDQLCDSLRSDEGWEYMAPTKEIQGFWKNDNFKMGFIIDGLPHQKKIYTPFSEPFSEKDLQLISTALQDRNIGRFLSNRLELLDKTLAKTEYQPLEEVVK